MMKTNESWPSESAASHISEAEGVIQAHPALKPLAAGDVSLTVADFARRSLSENTRRAYTRILKEFLAFTRTDPRLVTPQIVTGWRDELVRRKQKPATVNLKLAAVRSFYDYLHAGGYVAFNPALTKLVPPPALPEDMAGRALTPKEAVRLLAGPDRNRVEGARDHAILLTLLRLSLRVAELCSLRRSSSNGVTDGGSSSSPSRVVASDAFRFQRKFMPQSSTISPSMTTGGSSSDATPRRPSSFSRW